MHISKPLIIIGCAAAGITAIGCSLHTVRRRENLEKARIKQFAEPANNQSSYYSLARFSPNQTAFFQDAYGHQWSVTVQESSAVHERHWMRNLLVWSENPQYLELFGDPHHNNVAILGMSRELQEGQGFSLVDAKGDHHPFPAIKFDTLRRSTVAVT